MKCSTNHVLAVLLHWGRAVLENSARGGSQNCKVVGIEAMHHWVYVCMYGCQNWIKVLSLSLKCEPILLHSLLRNGCAIVVAVVVVYSCGNIYI